MIGTIASEFGCYSFDQLATCGRNKLHVLHAEALRQRAAKASFLALVINAGQASKEDRDKVNTLLDETMRPWKIRTPLTQEKIDTDWEMFRRTSG